MAPFKFFLYFQLATLLPTIVWASKEELDFEAHPIGCSLLVVAINAGISAMITLIKYG
jgi:hypothetical protein